MKKKSNKGVGKGKGGSGKKGAMVGAGLGAGAAVYAGNLGVAVAGTAFGVPVLASVAVCAATLGAIGYTLGSLWD